MEVKKILALVEGQTELGFVKHVLADHFKEIATIVPTLNTTKLVKSGTNFKGGITHYSRVKREILRLLNDTSAAIVTTMFDYYALPNDFPKFDEQTGNCYQRVEFLEKALQDDIDNPKFIPYLQLHEFEALLFSAPKIIDSVMSGNTSKSNLQAVRATFHSPEEINNDPSTCPSCRIRNEYPDYEKVIHGQIISKNIGIETILTECNHFFKWIGKMKSALGKSSQTQGNIFAKT